MFSYFQPEINFLDTNYYFHLISSRRPKLGILLIILGILSSMITTGFLTYLYDLPPVSLFSLPDPKYAKIFYLYIYIFFLFVFNIKILKENCFDFLIFPSSSEYCFYVWSREGGRGLQC